MEVTYPVLVKCKKAACVITFLRLKKNDAECRIKDLEENECQLNNYNGKDVDNSHSVEVKVNAITGEVKLD